MINFGQEYIQVLVSLSIKGSKTTGTEHYDGVGNRNKGDFDYDYTTGGSISTMKSIAM